MKTPKLAAVVIAILGGTCALLGYASVVRTASGPNASRIYVWFLFTGVLVVLGGGAALISRSRNGSTVERVCPRCSEQAEDDWTFCPSCGTRVEEGWTVVDHERENGLLAKTLFWLGIGVLDVLFVLVVLWLFVPSLALSREVFAMRGSGPLGMILLDAGVGCVLVGYSVAPSAVRA